MPKKHRQAYLNTKPNYVHSLKGGKQGAVVDAASSPTPPNLTVNERLSQLRLAQASPASLERKRELAEASNQRSLPPSVGQGIFGQAPTAAPRPRPGVRSRIRLRTPGPAPPPSWQSGSAASRSHHGSVYRLARPAGRTFGRKPDVDRPRSQLALRFIKLVGNTPVRDGSLLHCALRSAAENWEAIVEDCLSELEYLPLHSRSILLSYLSTYGPLNGVDVRILTALFPGLSDATCLDLTGFVGWNFTLKELRRWLTVPVEDIPASTSGDSASSGDEVVESWEEETTDDIVAPAIPPALTSRIRFLTKLSLAYPPSTISWGDLLSLSKDLGTLTHLSLAHWPVPTRTPNMKTASYITGTGTEEAASSTTLYSELDRNFEESAIILRQLSENTYCLRWLDLEGCSQWLAALTWQAPPPETDDFPIRSEWESSTRQSKPRGPDWRGAWRNIAYLNTSQTWVPQERQFINSAACKGRLAAKYHILTSTSLQIILDLVNSSSATDTAHVQKQCEVCLAPRNGSGDAQCAVCTAYYDQETARLARWLEREVTAWDVGRGIISARAGGKGLPVFDHGWQKKETYSVYAASAPDR
ncbi:hypothetical protein AAFC00_000142 [Neodothiora populina]|uniref:Uncharacterized protein n=1 Tax=Neodothiora populina TaxID=2781224 RepID=A0ABR3P1X0_9PEZI